MFASEHILWNDSFCALELSKSNKIKWSQRDFILTDKACYVFNDTPNGETADYLDSDKCERLDMNDFRAAKPASMGGLPPVYFSELPPQHGSFCVLLELLNRKTEKRRLISLQSQADSHQFLSMFNLVGSYRSFENQISTKGGPIFIQTWVQTYFQHKGEMVFDDQILQDQNIAFLLLFGTNNSAVKSLVFNECLSFLSDGKKTFETLFAILNSFSGESVQTFKLSSNGINDHSFASVATSFGNLTQLRHLEITFNFLTAPSLVTLATLVFKENQNLRSVVLHHNHFGCGLRQRESMTIFLEHFLCDLKSPESLDLSFNSLADEVVFPIVKYLLANLDCQMLHLNIEQNAFSPYMLRTIAQAQIRCPNKNLSLKFGPLPLTYQSLKLAVCQATTSSKDGFVESSEVVDIVIRRKAANPEQGLKYLPLRQGDRELIKKFQQRILDISAAANREHVIIEDILKLVSDISEVPFEFPKHLLEPIFVLINDLLAASIHHQNLYCLEVLLDALVLIGARNIPAETKYQELAKEAKQVASNLINAINMQVYEDVELLKILVESLNRAQAIGMRGELIDTATAFKQLIVKLLQEMLVKSNDDDEDQNFVFVLKEDDRVRSAFDPKYDEFVGLSPIRLGLMTDFEPNLGVHPYTVDYIKLCSINQFYLKRNMTQSAKFLNDEESYGLLNVYSRSSFLLANGGSDALKQMAFNYDRQDSQLKLTRLVFRYTKNSDQLFANCLEPAYFSHDHIESHKYRLREEIPRNNNTSLSLKMHTYKNLNCTDLNREQILSFSRKSLEKSLTRISHYQTGNTIKFYDSLLQITSLGEENQDVKSPLKFYRKIRTLFEQFVIKKSKVINNDIHDEMLLQLYKLSTKPDHQIDRTVFLVMTLLSAYIEPSSELVGLCKEWFGRVLTKQRHLHHLIRIMLANFQRPKFDPATKKFYICWPPSLAEIEAIDKNQPIYVVVLAPTGDSFKYAVDETTTIESLLAQVLKEQLFAQIAAPELYWLFQAEDNSDPTSDTQICSQTTKPFSREKKVIKLIYRDEKDFEQREESHIFASNMIHGNNNARTSLIGQRTIVRKLRSKNTLKKLSTLKSDTQSFFLQIRQRLFPSLHSIGNFSVLQSGARKLLFGQIREDYVDREVAQFPAISVADAVHLAALILKVQFSGKILRSKEHTLTKDLVQKNIDQAVPKSIKEQAGEKNGFEGLNWAERIVKDFEERHLKEQSLEESQDEFFKLLSKFEFFFASYHGVTRKPNVVRTNDMFKNQLQTGNIVSRKKFSPKNNLNTASKSKFDSSSSDETSSSDSETDLSSVVSSSSTDPTNSREVINQELLVRQEVFEEYLNNTQNDLLLVCTYDGLLFLEQAKRDKVLLRVKYVDLIYVMGKKDELKIGMLLPKKAKQPSGGRNIFKEDNFEELNDVRVELIAPNARTIAEDIIAYCQLNLLERSAARITDDKSSTQEYVEKFNRNIVDIFDDQPDMPEQQQAAPKAGNILIKVVVDDNLLVGRNQNASDLLKEDKAKYNRLLQQASEVYDISKLDFGDKEEDMFAHINLTTDSQEQQSKLRQNWLQNQVSSSSVKGEIYRKRLSKAVGNQFKIKMKEALVYLKKHPLYVQVELPPKPEEISQVSVQRRNAKQFEVISITGVIKEETEYSSQHTVKSGKREDSSLTSEGFDSEDSVIELKHSRVSAPPKSSVKPSPRNVDSGRSRTESTPLKPEPPTSTMNKNLRKRVSKVREPFKLPMPPPKTESHASSHSSYSHKETHKAKDSHASKDKAKVSKKHEKLKLSPHTPARQEAQLKLSPVKEMPQIIVEVQQQSPAKPETRPSVNLQAFMSQYKATNDKSEKHMSFGIASNQDQSVTPVEIEADRPKNIRFETKSKEEKKQQLGKVLGSLGLPPP